MTVQCHFVQGLKIIYHWYIIPGILYYFLYLKAYKLVYLAYTRYYIVKKINIVSICLEPLIQVHLLVFFLKREIKRDVMEFQMLSII